MANEEDVEVEGRIEHRTLKAILFLPTIGEKCWIPLSQVADISEPDGEGNVMVKMSGWIARKNELV